MSPSTTIFFLLSIFTVSCPALSLRDVFVAPDPDIQICLKFKVFVTNGIDDNTRPLIIHCKSNDDDLGNHTLWKGQDFHFHFSVDLFKYTHFSCDMNWGPKNLLVDVFRKHVEDHLCCPTHTCLWVAEEDGVYFGFDGTHWTRNYEW